jgi:hypothetical protein
MRVIRQAGASIASVGLLAVAGVFFMLPASAEGRPTSRAMTFDPQITNRWSPMPVGASYTSLGVQEGKLGLDRTSVLRRTKLISGTRCRIELDRVFLNGKPAERTFDYFAQDSKGNVWYFGEDSYTRRHGRWSRDSDSWLSGVNGAHAGIVMQAHPTPGPVYAQENFPGHAEDKARVLGYVSSLTVPGGTFRHVLETQEFSPLEPGVVERKYYAAGVGFLRSVTTRGPIEFFDLARVAR